MTEPVFYGKRISEWDAMREEARKRHAVFSRAAKNRLTCKCGKPKHYQSRRCRECYWEGLRCRSS